MQTSNSLKANLYCLTVHPVKGLLYWTAFLQFTAIVSGYFSYLYLLRELGWKVSAPEGGKASLASRFFVASWNAVPATLKIWLSAQTKRLYEMEFSRHFIEPYVFRNYEDHDNYLSNFRPYNGATSYESFQHFFARDLVIQPENVIEAASPCEGFVADVSKVSDGRTTNVKGEVFRTRDVFGIVANDIPNTHSFVNIFLSNRNYHHIHSPVSGTIEKIERAGGDLILLRPWFYDNPNVPPLINERVNIKIRDIEGDSWYLSVVGGPVVNSVVLPNGIYEGAMLESGQKVATFELGSTCCIAHPGESNLVSGTKVSLFQSMSEKVS